MVNVTLESLALFIGYTQLILGGFLLSLKVVTWIVNKSVSKALRLKDIYRAVALLREEKERQKQSRSEP